MGSQSINYVETVFDVVKDIKPKEINLTLNECLAVEKMFYDRVGDAKAKMTKSELAYELLQHFKTYKNMKQIFLQHGDIG